MYISANMHYRNVKISGRL